MNIHDLMTVCHSNEIFRNIQRLSARLPEMLKIFTKTMRGGSTHKRERKTHKINILHTGNIFRPQETFIAHKKHFAYNKHFSHTRKVLHTRNIFRTQETPFTHKKQTFFTCAKSFLCVKCFLCVKDCHVFPPISLDVFYTRKLRSSKNN